MVEAGDTVVSAVDILGGSHTLHRRDSHRDHLISKLTDSNIAAAERITSRTKYEWPATSQCHCQWLLGPTLIINILQAS